MNLANAIAEKYKICSLQDVILIFKDRETCIEALEYALWDGEPISPFDPTSKVYQCSNGKYFCRNTGKYFTVLTGTIFEATKLPLQKWFYAIYQLSCSKKGISSMQLAKDIGVMQSTAWNMLQKIRKYLVFENHNILEGEVELDETFVGGKNHNRHADKKVKNSQGRSFKDKTPVHGLLQRGGKLTAIVVENTSVSELIPNIYKYVKENSILYTDEWQAYDKINDNYTRMFVDHKKKQYVYGDVTTNTLEGAWSHLKRSIIGIYHKVSRKHLQLYVNEFVFRYNVAKMKVNEIFFWSLQHVKMRVTYNDIRYS